MKRKALWEDFKNLRLKGISLIWQSALSSAVHSAKSSARL